MNVVSRYSAFTAKAKKKNILVLFIDNQKFSIAIFFVINVRFLLIIEKDGD
jgi:hypothetical protein